MEGYDREIARERGAMASAGQGSAAGSGGAGGMIGEPGGSGGAMVTIPNATGGGLGGDGQGPGGQPAGGSSGDSSAGSSAGNGGGSGGGSGEGGPLEDGAPGEQPDTKIEIPEDIAEATGNEDQVARQIREAAEQEEDPRIREALWDEYRRHMGLKTR